MTNNIIQQNESLETSIDRVIHELNEDSTAILTATSINQASNASNMVNDFSFQNIDFEKLDDIFDAFNNQFFNLSSILTEYIKGLESKVDKKFVEDPFNESFGRMEPVIISDGSREINSEMYHIVRKFHKLAERVDDFKVNIASLAMVQSQFTGLLLHDVTQLYLQMIELNRQLSGVQNMVMVSIN